nr:immunoglobulin heavy chain junction region [Mus musculus]MBK4196117.1 immunoglobulin heavy chain junction region [Mus musculus]
CARWRYGSHYYAMDYW